MTDGPHGPRLNLAVLVEFARTIERREALARAICAHAVAGLGLAGASISMVRRDQGEPRLDSVAAVGQLSSFMADLSTPLSKPTDATKVASGGGPVFVGNPHGVQNGAEATDGVGRWRNGLSAHAFAVLGLNVLGGTTGVLILEWPEPHPFEDEDRRNLQLFADVVALVLEAAPTDSAIQGATGAHALRQVRASTASWRLDAQGAPSAVHTDAPGVGADSVRIWTATTHPDAPGGAVAFAEVVPAASGGVLCATGALSAGPTGGAEEALAAGRSVLRAAAAHGSGPHEALAMLGSSLRSQPHPVWASGVAARLTPTTGALETATAGAAAVLVLGREDRLEASLSDSPPIGAGRITPPARFDLVLPGDRVAVICAERMADSSSTDVVSEAAHLLRSLPERGGEDTAAALLSLISDGVVSSAVTVIEFAGDAGTPAP